MLFLSLMPLSESHIPHINILKKGKKKESYNSGKNIPYRNGGGGDGSKLAVQKKLYDLLECFTKRYALQRNYNWINL